VAPWLIVHGDADRVVPIVEGETMYEALSKAGCWHRSSESKALDTSLMALTSHVPLPKW